MDYFVSYELYHKIGDPPAAVGSVVITGSTAGSVMADLEAIKNDCGCPGATIRVLCLTVLPSTPPPEDVQ